MELVLESGFDVETLEEVLAEPQPVEVGIDNETYYAEFEFEAISLEECDALAACDGYSLKGNYVVETFPADENTESGL